jgi:apoptosis-inducing factor 2
MKKLVVIGGGFAGALIAKRLQKHFNLTLIDSKSYFEFTPSILRTLVEPEHAELIEVEHTHYLTDARVIVGEVEDVDEEFVYIEAKKISYDYLVICSGSKYSLPIKGGGVIIASRGKELRKYSAKLRGSHNVLIIGGGLVGIELASEIADRFPTKNITLVHSKQELIPRSPKKARDYAQKFLEKKGVKLIFGEKVKDGKTCITNRGRRIEADIKFLCTGIVSNYEFMVKHFRKNLNPKNQIIVNEYLQVKGYDNIFAAGDVTSVNEEKTAQNSEDQAKVIIKNLLRLEAKHELKAYRSTPRVMVANLGKRDGFLMYRDFVFCGRIAAILKNIIERKTMRRYV